MKKFTAEFAEFGIVTKLSVRFLIHECLVSKCREEHTYFLVWKEIQQDLAHPGERDEQSCVRFQSIRKVDNTRSGQWLPKLLSCHCQG